MFELGLILVSVVATAQAHASASGAPGSTDAATAFSAYRQQHSLSCVGPLTSSVAETSIQLANKTYEYSGSKLAITSASRDGDDEVRFGVLSSIKDFLPETKRNLEKLLDWYDQEKVEWLILNGDVGGEEEEFTELMDFLGQRKTPLLVSIGNYESRGTYFRVVGEAAAKYPWIIDQNLVRVVEADDVTVVSLPGYYDRRFLHTGSGCLYRPEDVDATLDVAEKIPGAKLLVSHGPPRGEGQKALDVINEGRVNVGDVEMSRLIKEGKFQFGVFGHILESGGRAVGGDLSSPVAADTLSNQLFVNVGSANGLPWMLNDGSIASGMGAVFTVKGQKAKVKFRILRDSKSGPATVSARQ